MPSFVVAHGNIHRKHTSMPVSLELALVKAKEYGSPRVRKLISLLPTILSEDGFDAYMGVLGRIRGLITGWKTLDGVACRREICKAIRGGTRNEAPPTREQKKILRSGIMQVLWGRKGTIQTVKVRRNVGTPVQTIPVPYVRVS